MLVAPSVGSYWPQFLIVAEFAGAEMKICMGSPVQGGINGNSSLTGKKTDLENAGYQHFLLC